jgi:hypothetical protein
MTATPRFNRTPRSPGTVIASPSSGVGTPCLCARDYHINVQHLENENFTLKLLLWQLQKRLGGLYRSHSVSEDTVEHLLKQDLEIAGLRSEISEISAKT